MHTRIELIGCVNRFVGLLIPFDVNKTTFTQIGRLIVKRFKRHTQILEYFKSNLFGKNVVLKMIDFYFFLRDRLSTQVFQNRPKVLTKPCRNLSIPKFRR